VVTTGESTESGDAVASSSPAFGTVTQAGALVGTPAYMAPEQLKGKPTDARADQFALCVSVWEALFDARPYSGRTPAEITSSIEDAKFEIPEHARPVSRRLVAALRRGMAHDPKARWPSLAPLLAELRYDPAKRRRQLLVGGALGAVLLAAAIIVAMSLSKHRETPCTDGPAQISRVWNPQRSRALASSFETARLGDSWPSVDAIVDGYANEWVDGYRSACRAARVDGSESAALLDKRMLCLNRARSRLDTLLTSFATNRESAAVAADQTSRLPNLAQCADSSARR
jgi:serine/threonine protein kinase